MDKPIVKNLITHVDDRGCLTELCRVDWDEVPTEIRQVYSVQNHSKGTVRAFHCHNELIDYFNIVKGSAKFILFHYDKFKEFCTKPVEDYNLGFIQEFCESEWYQEYTLSDKKMQMLYIPPRWMHGWISLEDGTMLLSNASDVFNPDKIDCERVEWTILGNDIWETKFK